MNKLTMITMVEKATTYAELNDFDNAFYYLDKALDCSNRTPDEMCRIDLAYDYISMLNN